MLSKARYHWRRAAAVLTISALIITAPGLPCWQALAAASSSGGGKAFQRPGVRLGNFGAPISRRAAPLGISAAIGSLAIQKAVPAIHFSAPRLSDSRPPSSPAPRDEGGEGQLFPELIKDKDIVAPVAEEISRMPPAEAKSVAAGAIDRILRIKAAGVGNAISFPRAGSFSKAKTPAITLSAAGQSPTPPAPEGEEPARGPPRIEATSASPAKDASFLARLWTRVTSFLPLRNSGAYWILTLGKAMLTLGTSFFEVAANAATGLVVPTKAFSARMGYKNAAESAAGVAASVLIGPKMDSFSLSKVLVWTTLGLGLLSAAVPLLFLVSAPTSMFFAVAFIGITSLKGLLYSVNSTADSGGSSKILDQDTSYRNRANLFSSLITSSFGMLGQLLAGSFIGHALPKGIGTLFNGAFGQPLGSNALACGISGLVAIVVAVAFALFLRFPQEEVPASQNAPQISLIKEVSPKNSHSVIKHKYFRELRKGFRIIMRDRFLKFSLFCATISSVGLGAMSVVVGGYIRDVLNLSTLFIPDWLTQLPGVGPFLSGLFTQSGALGMYGAISFLGMMLTVPLMLFLEKMSQGRANQAALNAAQEQVIGEVSPADALKSMDRQGKVSTILYGVGLLALFGVFFSPIFWHSAAWMLLSATLQGPVLIIGSSIVQEILRQKYPQHRSKIFTILALFELFCAMVGGLAFGGMMAVFPTALVLKIWFGVMALGAVVHIAVEPAKAYPIRWPKRPRS